MRFWQRKIWGQTARWQIRPLLWDLVLVRVIHSPAEGKLYGRVKIGDKVEKGQTIAVICTENGEEVKVEATLTGLVRGLIRDAYPVTVGFKIADIDPRESEYKNCFTISDKARNIGGSVLEGLMYLEEKQGY